MLLNTYIKKGLVGYACTALLLASSPTPGFSQAVTTAYSPTQGQMTDDQIYQTLETESRRLLNAKQTTAFTQLAEQLDKTHCQVKLPKASQKPLPDAQLFEQCRKSVLIIGTLYKCPTCPNDHVRPASGFVISEEGIGVTSYHLFRGHATNEDTDLALTVMDADGHVYPIKEVLAASLINDVAIFRFDTGGRKLPALSLGADARVGDDAKVIGHPHSMFYSFTRGVVSRYYEREEGNKMSVTADFSQGSSGGPILNNKGQVIGVVSATRSLYNTDQNLQMVSREAIPVKAIRELIQP
jgi:serine protease Do